MKLAFFLRTVQCKRVFEIPWSQSTFATFLVLLRGVFWVGGREGKGGVEREREREGRDFCCSQCVPIKFPMRSPTCSQ